MYNVNHLKNATFLRFFGLHVYCCHHLCFFILLLALFHWLLALLLCTSHHIASSILLSFPFVFRNHKNPTAATIFYSIYYFSFITLYSPPFASWSIWLFPAGVLCQGIIDVIKRTCSRVRREHLWLLLQDSVTEFAMREIGPRRIACDFIMQKCPVSSHHLSIICDIFYLHTYFLHIRINLCMHA